jgi:hypothetical protein
LKNNPQAITLEVQLHDHPPKAIMMGNSTIAYPKYNSRRFIENRIKRIFWILVVDAPPLTVTKVEKLAS